MPEWSDFQRWADSISLWQAIGWAAGFIGLVIVVVWFKRKGWPWLLAFAQAILNTAQIIDSVKELPDFIKRTDATLQQQNESIASIHHETHNNDGSSIKDSVDRIELGVKGLYPRIDALESADASHEKHFQEIDERTQPRPPKETS